MASSPTLTLPLDFISIEELTDGNDASVALVTDESDENPTFLTAPNGFEFEVPPSPSPMPEVTTSGLGTATSPSKKKLL